MFVVGLCAHRWCENFFYEQQFFLLSSYPQIESEMEDNTNHYCFLN